LGTIEKFSADKKKEKKKKVTATRWARGGEKRGECKTDQGAGGGEHAWGGKKEIATIQEKKNRKGKNHLCMDKGTEKAKNSGQAKRSPDVKDINGQPNHQMLAQEERGRGASARGIAKSKARLDGGGAKATAGQ